MQKFLPLLLEQVGSGELVESRADNIVRLDSVEAREAREHFEAALAVEPNVHTGRLKYGTLLWKLGEDDTAAKELEAANEFPAKIVDGLRDMGAFGMRIPEEYGGLGLDLVGRGLLAKHLERKFPPIGDGQFGKLGRGAGRGVVVADGKARCRVGAAGCGAVFSGNGADGTVRGDNDSRRCAG